MKNIKIMMIMAVAAMLTGNSYAGEVISDNAVSDNFVFGESAEETDMDLSEESDEACIVEDSFTAEEGLIIPDVPVPAGEATRPLNENEEEAAGILETFPETFDPRTEGLAVPVTDQKATNNCWAHATLTAIATNYKKEYGETLSLDAQNFVREMYFRTEDPKGLANGDKTVYVKNGKVYTEADTSQMSGNPDYTTNLFSTWAAPVTGDSYVYEGRACQIESASTYYRGDWDMNTIKRLITENGAVAAYIRLGYTGDPSYMHPWQNTKTGRYLKYADYSTWDKIPNHEIVIVGWDDTIPKEEFKNPVNESMPSRDGGWLIQNSWGDDWCDGGFCWVSYDDGSFKEDSLNDIVSFNFRETKYDNNYFYDGSTIIDGFYVKSACNEFTIDNNEILGGTGLNLGSRGNYIVKAYLDGEVIEQKTISVYDIGYVTVDFDSHTALPSGSRVKIEVKREDGQNFNLYVDKAGSNSYMKFETEQGEGYSFYSMGNGYTDLGVTGSTARIKLFTDNAEDTGKINIENAEVRLPDGNEYRYHGWNISPKYTIIYDGRELVEGTDYIKQYAGNSVPGTARIIFTGKGGFSGKKMVKYEILDRIPLVSEDVKISLEKDKWAYTGKQIEPKVTITYKDREVDYTTDEILLQYRDNIKIGEAYVRIVAQSDSDFKGQVKLTYNIVKEGDENSVIGDPETNSEPDEKDEKIEDKPAQDNKPSEVAKGNTEHTATAALASKNTVSDNAVSENITIPEDTEIAEESISEPEYSFEEYTGPEPVIESTEREIVEAPKEKKEFKDELVIVEGKAYKTAERKAARMPQIIETTSRYDRPLSILVKVMGILFVILAALVIRLLVVSVKERGESHE